jgi:hypothetical protein
MSGNLDNATFKHCYTNRKSNKPWSCDSLYDAYHKYEWPHPAIPRLKIEKGTDFKSNAQALDALQIDLCQSLSHSNDADTLQAAIDVVCWGGVGPGNVRWLNANEKGLAALLVSTQKILNESDTSQCATILRFNAGMTKVYSLLCNSFIIYDSRVAAALGWAVGKFYKDKGPVHEALLFPWAPAREGRNAAQKKLRDPGLGKNKQLQSGAMHAEWNLKASWLLKAVLAEGNAKVSNFNVLSGPGNPLRRLEAALFMFGYDLPTDSAPMGKTPCNRPAPPTDAVNGDSDEPWIECHTLGKNPQTFDYRLVKDAIETRYKAVRAGKIGIHQLNFFEANINSILVALWHHFGESPFPLANSASGVAGRSTKYGLGTAYLVITGKGAPNSSKLAAVLEDLRIFVPFAVPRTRDLRWTINSELLAISKIEELDIGPILNAAWDRLSEQ